MTRVDRLASNSKVLEAQKHERALHVDPSQVLRYGVDLKKTLREESLEEQNAFLEAAADEIRVG